MENNNVDTEFQELAKNDHFGVKIGIVVGVLLLIGLSVLLSIKGTTELKEDNYLIEIQVEDFYELYNSNEQFVLLLGRPGCPHCVAFKPIITRVANNYKHNIYYLNTDNIETTEDWVFIWDLAQQEGTPTVAIIENKKLIDSRSGEMTREELISWLSEEGVL